MRNHHLYPLFLLFIALSRCSPEASYQNKGFYRIAVADSVPVYYSTNSCRYYCIGNETELKHVRLIRHRMVDPGPEDCDGCNYTAAFVFEGISRGTDTLKLRMLGAGSRADCDNDSIPCERYVVEVR